MHASNIISMDPLGLKLLPSSLSNRENTQASLYNRQIGNSTDIPPPSLTLLVSLSPGSLLPS
jgi:hypothetical protein